MRLWAAVVGLCSIWTIRAEIRSSKDAQVPPKYPIGQFDEPFAKANGRLFEINGTVGYFSGCNAWWLGHLTNDDDVLKALEQIAETGYKIIRIWGFGDIAEAPEEREELADPNKVWYQYINSTGGYINYDENGLNRLDFVVSACEKLGLKLVVPFINNWPEYGGMDLYIKVYGETPDQEYFYDVEKAQEVYKDYIKVIVNRYIKSPAIFSWQLGNEPRCTGCESSVVYNWAVEISAYIKSLDPDHMVSLGEEGWLAPSDGVGDGRFGYNGYNGVSFTDNFQIETIDYGTVHLWPSHWTYPFEWGVQWIEEHDAIGAKFNKPIILEEYGSPGPVLYIETQTPWQEALLKSGIAADQIWQFAPGNTSVPPADLGDPYTIYYGSEEWEVLGYKHAHAMLAREVGGSGEEGLEEIGA